ncbi:MAG: VOC family protein [Rhodomicrobium sp.]
MLIDWERAGPGRPFEIQVPDVVAAQSFYGKVFGARETSRYETAEGELVRLGLAVGLVRFTISSEKGEEAERPLLSLLAADLGVPYVAIMLHVEDLDRMAYRAEKNGAQVSALHESGDIVIFTDPFGSHWVLKRREAAVHAHDPKIRH